MTTVDLDIAWSSPGYLPVAAEPVAASADNPVILDDGTPPEEAKKPKIIVIHDDNGVITQTILQVEIGTQALSDRYVEMGIQHILYDGDVDITNAYVKDGEVMPKPTVSIDGDVRSIKADGIDSLSLNVSPSEFDVFVALDGAVIHQENVVDGKLEFSVDHPGSYIIGIAPAHPYRPLRLEIEATA
ncbi:hypothetical protein [Bradyrhizobium australafricanum]|uniref:hypothetical protein n=1 Tax=Bradyrhizobium australafricanum TaxID=2821406 RepID=UPI001CE38DDA|nr:hypothetical protein [Bradyrhizobium australafricanum]MCA6098876.1 hypothetical protein [Bradyrhizobium australafricanum]